MSTSTDVRLLAESLSVVALPVVFASVLSVFVTPADVTNFVVTDVFESSLVLGTILPTCAALPNKTGKSIMDLRLLV